MIKLPKTRQDWLIFMNGYRDPIERQAVRNDYFKEYGEYPSPPTGSGGENERECGYRKEGGTYAVSPTSKNGKPVEYFMTCKPLPIDPEEYNLANVGVKLVDILEPCFACKKFPSRTGLQCSICNGTGKELVSHIFDVVGKDNYPNVADFMEEARRLGVSRRLELEDKKQYARLSRRSKLFLLHSKAVIENPEEIYKALGETETTRLQRAGCPKALSFHGIKGDRAFVSIDAYEAPGCAALQWHILTDGEELPEEMIKQFDPSGADKPTNFVRRELASGQYRGYKTPESITVKASLGVFAVFPLGRIEVVDPSGEYEDRVERAGAARLDVITTDC